MKFKLISIILSVFVFISCDPKRNYHPNDLRELTEEELIESAKGNKVFTQKNAIYKDNNGEIIPADSLRNMKYGCFNNLYFAKYVNENNDIIEVVLRPATQLELETKAKISLAWLKEPNVKIVEIDCNKIGQILDTIYELDQGMRQNGNSIDTAIENQILNKAISIVENCGMPTLNDVTEHQMMGLWLVFQHTHHNIRKRYFPLFIKSAENGDLKMSQIALMEDRILMMEGKPQKYGSQVQAGCTTDWELYNLANPETVDKRRLKMGMIPLKDYLIDFGINFEVEQIE
jgi:hypothetical protein